MLCQGVHVNGRSGVMQSTADDGDGRDGGGRCWGAGAGGAKSSDCCQILVWDRVGGRGRGGAGA